MLGKQSTPIVCLSDWANVGNERHLVKVRPNGGDSLASRIRENRTTEADETAQSLPLLATHGDIVRLADHLMSRYGVRPDTPTKRRELAQQAAVEIANHTLRRPSAIWRSTVAEVCKAIELLPSPSAVAGNDNSGITQSLQELTNYVAAKEIRLEHTPPGVVLNHKQLKRFLEDHPKIRRRPGVQKDGSPRTNRLLVHLADWHKHRKALVEWDDAKKRDPIDTTPDAEIEQRREAVQARKERASRQGE